MAFSDLKRENPFPRENISLLNLHVTPGLDLKNTFICKLIGFISLVSAFNLIFFSGYFNLVPHRPHFCQSPSYSLTIRKGTFENRVVPYRTPEYHLIQQTNGIEQP